MVRSDLGENLTAVRMRMEKAASRAGRNLGEIKLVAVSKTHPTEVLREAAAAGIAVFGENKVQEAEEKIAALGTEGIEWHLVGHLQKNKARKAVQLFNVIHSIDSPEIAHRLERICEEENRRALSVFIQVDLAGEKNKSCIPETQLQLLVEMLKR